jgi:hypothetical protein
MSRHVVKQTDDVLVVVGWDPPLQTFFLQVFDEKEENENKAMKLWLGASRSGEIPALEDLEAHLGAYSDITGGAVLSDEVREKLVNDQNHTTTPSPLQRMMIDRLMPRRGPFDDWNSIDLPEK